MKNNVKFSNLVFDKKIRKVSNCAEKFFSIFLYIHI
nr:MAG TPA: hypothetical protein [Caudoviricetes sp.]